MGKETLLELTFGPGGWVPGAKGGAPVLAPPPAGEGSGGRRAKDDTDRNWLVKSLTLPHLGQATNNAAKSAMEADEKETGWGWLADEVTLRAEEAAEELPPEILPEEGLGPKTPQEVARAGGLPSAGEKPAGARAGEEGGAPATAADFPDRAEAGQKPTDRAAEREEASARDLSGGTREASGTMASFRETRAVAEMSQTRRMIDELSAGVRAELSAWRTPVPQEVPGSGAGAGADRIGAGRGAGDWTSLSGGAGVRVGEAGRFSAGSTLPGGRGGGSAAWGGGWNATPAGESGLSRLGEASVPAPAVVVPVPARGESLPGAAGRGSSLGVF